MAVPRTQAACSLDGPRLQSLRWFKLIEIHPRGWQIEHTYRPTVLAYSQPNVVLAVSTSLSTDWFKVIQGLYLLQLWHFNGKGRSSMPRDLVSSWILRRTTVFRRRIPWCLGETASPSASELGHVQLITMLSEGIAMLPGRTTAATTVSEAGKGSEKWAT